MDASAGFHLCQRSIQLGKIGKGKSRPSRLAPAADVYHQRQTAHLQAFVETEGIEVAIPFRAQSKHTVLQALAVLPQGKTHTEMTAPEELPLGQLAKKGGGRQALAGSPERAMKAQGKERCEAKGQTALQKFTSRPNGKFRISTRCCLSKRG